MSVVDNESAKLEPLSRDDVLRGIILSVSVFLIFFGFSSDEKVTGIFSLLISALFLFLLFVRGPISVEPNYLFERYADNFGFYLDKAEKYLYASTSEDLEKIKVWMRSCYTQNFQEINSQVEWFNSLSKIKKRTFLIYSLKLMREALVSGIDESLSKISDVEMSFISKFRTTLESDDFEEIIIFLDESIRFLDRNANPKILFLDLSIKISNLFKKVKN